LFVELHFPSTILEKRKKILVVFSQWTAGGVAGHHYYPTPPTGNIKGHKSRIYTSSSSTYISTRTIIEIISNKEQAECARKTIRAVNEHGKRGATAPKKESRIIKRETESEREERPARLLFVGAKSIMNKS
jgi:hypothetical protein